MHLRLVIISAVLMLLTVAAAQAEAVRELFAGKEISLLIGAGAGGGADIYARVLARHYGRHLPGAPAVVPKNVPGAGGLRVLNQLYNVSPKDGTEIAISLAAPLVEPLFGNKGAMFDPTKFTWIGNMDSDATVCFTGKLSGIKQWQDLKNRETTFGASGPSSTASIQAKIMGELLGLKVRMIHGYQGVRTSVLAMQRGELDGACGIYISTLRAQFASDLARGDLSVWIVFHDKRIKEFPEVPTIHELLRSDEDRQLAHLIYGQNVLGRPLSAPPRLSGEAAGALRQGFTLTMTDPSFLEEATKTGLNVTAMDAEQTLAWFEKLYQVPHSVVQRAKAIIADR